MHVPSSPCWCVHEAGCGKLKWALARSLSLSARCPFFMGHRSHLSASLWRTSKFLLCPHLVLKHTPAISNRPKRSAPALVYPNKSLQERCSGVVSNNRMTLLWLRYRVNTEKHLHHNKCSCYYTFLRHFPLFPWFMAVALACVNQPQPAISSRSGVSIVVVKFSHQTGMWTTQKNTQKNARQCKYERECELP